MQPWSNRIVRFAEVSPLELFENPDNWRVHPPAQAESLGDVLRKVGVVQSVIVNLRTGPEWPDEQRNRPTLVDGHLRVRLAIVNRQPTIPVVFVDLPPNEERLILATLDPLGAMAEAGREALGSLVSSIEALPDAPAINSLLDELARAARPPVTARPQDDMDERLREAQQRMLDRFKGRDPSILNEFVDIVCPACGNEFSMLRGELVSGGRHESAAVLHRSDGAGTA